MYNFKEYIPSKPERNRGSVIGFRKGELRISMDAQRQINGSDIKIYVDNDNHAILIKKVRNGIPTLTSTSRKFRPQIKLSNLNLLEGTYAFKELRGDSLLFILEND